MSRIQDEIYEMAQGLYNCGGIDKARMLEYEARYSASLAEESTEKAATENAEQGSGKPGQFQVVQA